MADLVANPVGQAPKLQRALWPPNGIETPWLRLQPLLKPAELKAFHLFGIPLVSGAVDPTTGLAQAMDETALQLHIERAVELAEMETGLTIMPTYITEHLAFDRHAFDAYGYLQLDRRPCWGVERLTIRTSSNEDIYFVPLEWIATQALYRGQVNVIPLTIAVSGTFLGTPTASGASGAAFLAAIGAYSQIARYWGCNALYGFPDGQVPAGINELVGTIAAMEVLSMLAATHARIQSTNASLDGFGQGTSLAGQTIYDTRLKALQEKREKLVNKLKTVFGLRYALGVS